MKKLFIISIILLFNLFFIKGQSIYKDSLIEINGYFNMKDQTVCIRIKNISDSNLVFNQPDVTFQKINNKYEADLSFSIHRNSVNYSKTDNRIQLRQLLPNSIYDVVLEKADTNLIDTKMFKLNFIIDYLVISDNQYLHNLLPLDKFFWYLKNTNDSLYRFEGVFLLNDSFDQCYKPLYLDSVNFHIISNDLKKLILFK
jgi:hypothetical protein